MKSFFASRFLTASAACLFLIVSMSGCSQDGVVESVSGSGSFVSADGTTVTEFEIDTSVIFETEIITTTDPETGEVTETEVPCTDLIQYGMATFTDCAADIQATVMLTPEDELTVRECFDILEENPDLEADPEYQTWLECVNEYTDDNDSNLYSLSYLGGRYEIRSCTAQQCDYFLFLYFPYFDVAYFYEIEEPGECFDHLDEGFNVFGSCGWWIWKHYFGVYVHCEGSDEVVGTGCAFAVIADEREEVDETTGETLAADDEIALLLVDDDGTVAYTNCGFAGDSISSTSIDPADFPDGLRICQDGLLGNDDLGGVIFRTGSINGNNTGVILGGNTFTVTVEDTDSEFTDSDEDSNTFTFANSDANN